MHRERGRGGVAELLRESSSFKNGIVRIGNKEKAFSISLLHVVNSNVRLDLLD